MMVGLMARSLDEDGRITLDPAAPGTAERVASAIRTFSVLLTEAQLGIYVLRNFLSHAGSSVFPEEEKPRFQPLDLAEIVEYMVRLHERVLPSKQLTIETQGLDRLPRIFGDGDEIRRLLYNVLSNAFKYSYHSVPSAHRTIRVFSKVPYDPGFRERRFALVVENYGLGVTDEERKKVFEPGFRGDRARREVPIGSGIGLSEVKKIMRLHRGHVRLRSRLVHPDTYLTAVELVFPFPSAKAEA
jgi:signal transduction histidine kinase